MSQSHLTPPFLCILQVSKSKHNAVIRELALFIYTSETPFYRLQNPHLHKAFELLGITVPDEKAFRTTLLDSIFEEVESEVMLKLMALLKVRTSADGSLGPLLVWFQSCK